MPQTTVVLCVVLSLAAVGQTQRSPHVEKTERQIKALAEDDIAAYLTGQGMGFGRAAELNHYPGPKHVLDLATRLALTKDQIEKTTIVYEDMLDEAMRLGKLIVENESMLNELFARQTIDESQLRSAVMEIASLQGELRITHLKAHLAMKSILSPHQIKKYDELRGYGH